MKLVTLFVLLTFVAGIFADTTTVELVPQGPIALDTTAKEENPDVNSLTEREFMYLLHKEKMAQDSLIASQTKELSVTDKPEGLYKTAAVFSIVISTLLATLTTIAFVSSSN